MRRFTAIILFSVFVVAQYAKQVSYLECKLSNYLGGASEKCDCEKLLKESKGNADQSSFPVTHNHVHIDELYCLSRHLSQQEYFNSYPAIHIVATQTLLNDGVYRRPDRPPN